jgi:hypothetical protein
MRRRDQWLQWIRPVEREGELIAVALVVLEDRLCQDPSMHGSKPSSSSWSPRDGAGKEAQPG